MNQEQLIELIKDIQTELAKDFELDQKNRLFTAATPNHITLKVHDQKLFTQYQGDLNALLDKSLKGNVQINIEPVGKNGLSLVTVQSEHATLTATLHLMTFEE